MDPIFWRINFIQNSRRAVSPKFYLVKGQKGNS
jgi:hypothetical protein